MSLQKKLTGEYAASLVEDGMKVGIGTGSTAYFMIMKLGKRVREGLDILGVATSEKTARLCEEEGIPLLEIDEVRTLDICIDGADEFDPNLQLIKGGGGALLREKMVASIAETFVVIVDQSKQVDHLGAFPLPVEIVPFGWKHTLERLVDMELRPELRKKEGKAFLTDNGNYILDCQVGKIDSPSELERRLKGTLGVVEAGLFIDMATKVIMADEEGKIEIIVR